MGTQRVSIAGHIIGASATLTFGLEADEISTNPAANQSTVRTYLTAVVQTNNYANNNRTLKGFVNGFEIDVNAAIALGSGGWTQGPWDVVVTHNADGTATIPLSLDTTLVDWFSNLTTAATSLALTTLVQVPGTPTAVTATRVSDTSATVAFTQNTTSNSAPTSTTVAASINGAAYATVATGGNVSSLGVATAANRKYLFEVAQANAAGSSAYSAASLAYFTSPAAPTNVVATRSGANIAVTFTDNVAFTEHNHVLLHGTVSGGTTTWDASALATIAAGTTSYTHTSPSTTATHVYQLTAGNTDTAALKSAAVVSNQVAPPVAPNKPTVAALPTYADKAKTFTVAFTHNPADSSPQSAYELQYSSNGGTSWTTTGKQATTASTASSATGFAVSGTALTFTGNQALTVQVRTWGLATTGGSDTTGASPWSDPQTVTFKTAPTVTITSPTTANWVTGALSVALSFSQAESATFVSADIQLFQGTTLLEDRPSTTLASTPFATIVANGVTYKVTAVVTDSNGLTSALASVTFPVVYGAPVTAVLAPVYDSATGTAQLNVTIPSPSGGTVAAVSMTILRTVGTVTETVDAGRAVSAGTIAILDMGPTVHGANVYQITTTSASGTTATLTQTLTTTEGSWAYFSRGTQIVRLRAALTLASTPVQDATEIPTAGRSRPVVLYGPQGTFQVSGTALIVTGDGSSVEDIEAFLLTPGNILYRDPSGRRITGHVTGAFTNRRKVTASFAYTVSEAS